MLGVKRFYYVNWGKSSFSVKSSDFHHGPLSILWHNQGLYRLIPVAMVINTIRYLEYSERSGDFFWDQGLEISPEIGKQLFNEQFNNQTNSNKS